MTVFRFYDEVCGPRKNPMLYLNGVYFQEVNLTFIVLRSIQDSSFFNLNCTVNLPPAYFLKIIHFIPT